METGYKEEFLSDSKIIFIQPENLNSKLFSFNYDEWNTQMKQMTSNENIIKLLEYFYMHHKFRSKFRPDSYFDSIEQIIQCLHANQSIFEEQNCIIRKYCYNILISFFAYSEKNHFIKSLLVQIKDAILPFIFTAPNEEKEYSIQILSFLSKYILFEEFYKAFSYLNITYLLNQNNLCIITSLLNFIYNISCNIPEFYEPTLILFVKRMLSFEYVNDSFSLLIFNIILNISKHINVDMEFLQLFIDQTNQMIDCFDERKLEIILVIIEAMNNFIDKNDVIIDFQHELFNKIISFDNEEILFMSLKLLLTNLKQISLPEINPIHQNFLDLLISFDIVDKLFITIQDGSLEIKSLSLMMIKELMSFEEFSSNIIPKCDQNFIECLIELFCTNSSQCLYESISHLVLILLDIEEKEMETSFSETILDSAFFDDLIRILEADPNLEETQRLYAKIQSLLQTRLSS